MASIFSKIIDGELPGHFVWRDEQVVAIMTIQPFRPGHVLVIPVQEIDQWDDMPPELAAACMRVSQHIARALKAEFSCSRIGMMIVGLEVPHTHLHLVPIDDLGDMSFANARGADQARLADEAERIRRQLQGMGFAEAEL